MLIIFLIHRKGDHLRLTFLLQVEGTKDCWFNNISSSAGWQGPVQMSIARSRAPSIDVNDKVKEFLKLIKSIQYKT